MIVDRSGHSIWTETPLLASEEDDQGELACRHGRCQQKRSAKRRRSRSVPQGKKNQRDARKVLSPPLPLFSLPSLPAIPFRPITDTARVRSFDALRWLVCVAPSLPRCTFSLFLGAMKTPGGRARSDSSLSSSGATPTSMSFRLPRLLQHGHAATMPINFKSALCSPFLPSLGGLSI